MKATNGLTVLIDIKDKQGRIVGHKEVATYRGLLAKAHDEGLTAIVTELLQRPDEGNGRAAIVRAQVTTRKGTFSGIGDASPQNVRAGIVPHLVRMAETRAKARALRDAVNIGIVALEELGELLEDELSYEGDVRHEAAGDGQEGPPVRETQETPSGAARPAPWPTRNDFQPMSDNQRRLLFRLAAQRGITPEDAKAFLEKQLGVESLKSVSRGQASRLIDRLQADGNGAPAGSAEGSP
jgi:hypothetical protein